MTFFRVFFLLTLFSTPLFSQWFWEEHYYEIPYSGKTYYSKGKPRTEGEFTVFNKWPENLEWRVKTQHVKIIKDIGPLAAAEHSLLLSIFNPLLSLNDKSKLISLNELKTAKDRGYSDDQIWSVLKDQSQFFSEAQKSGFTLDRLAKFFDQEVKQ